MADMNDYITNQEEFKRNVTLTIFGGTVQLFCLLVVLWISIQKPWKRKEKCKT